MIHERVFKKLDEVNEYFFSADAKLRGLTIINMEKFELEFGKEDHAQYRTESKLFVARQRYHVFYKEAT